MILNERPRPPPVLQRPEAFLVFPKTAILLHAVAWVTRGGCMNRPLLRT